MNIDPAEQVFEDILPYFETLDAQVGAIVQLLKDKGITTNEEFARYVKQADNASNVRKRGFRVRMEYLFTHAAERSEFVS
jgi:NH3-dependent NAD+ synthetase